MKKDTITITRAEYAQLHKAANAAVEHALELVQASRLVDDLKARIAELEAERDALKARITVAEMGLEELENYGKELEADVNTLQVKLAAREEYIESQEANIRFLKRACGWNN